MAYSRSSSSSISESCTSEGEGASLPRGKSFTVPQALSLVQMNSRWGLARLIRST